jgi:N-acetylglucosamine kinase-like BadF-type ATPase
VKYAVGVDIGGTKSHIALFDTAGTLVDFAHWGGLNHEGLPGSFGQFHKEMQQFAGNILSKNGIKIDQVESAAFGISGVDTKAQYGIVSGILTEIGFKKFALANDAFLGIPAGSPLGTGICAINGTGCTLAGINKEGKMLQIGGVGYISADYGGGGGLGREVISAVYCELFRKGEPTCLTQVLFEKLGITNKYDYIDKIYEKFDSGSLRITSLTLSLFDAAMKNDKVALDILYNSGMNYANGICGMIEELEFDKSNEDIYIVFAGSVFVKGIHPMITDTIKENLGRQYPGLNLKYTMLNMPPVAGAVFWALNNLGTGDKKALYEKVCSQFDNKAASKN